MAKNSEKTLVKHKAAITEAIEAIEKCRDSHSKTLEIGYNGYLNVFPEEIRQLTWLTSLSVVGTDIKVLPDWIGELEKLRVLDISSNQKIRNLPSSLTNLKHLKKLNLGNTGIKKLPSFLGNLHSLELLEIGVYNIKEVPQCILDLPKLNRIETRGYDISHLPSLVVKQHELNVKEFFRRIERCKKNKTKKLDLSYLYLSELPKEFSDLYWLQELDLTCNDLRQLPEWIGNFSELTVLNLSYNELTSLSDSIGNLLKLKKIWLDNNHLQTLPETFGNLKSLEILFLSEGNNNSELEGIYGQGSWFTSFPESFGNLSSLKTFSINNTKIKGLPESFGNLKSLRELFIHENIGKEFYFPGSMKNLKELRYVCIDGFDKVPDFIGELKELTDLDISHNVLYTLPDFIGNLKKLKTLNLHSTWIKELPEWVGNLKNLVELDISSNDIVVDPEISKRLPKLKKFYDCYNVFNAEKSKNKK